MSALVEKSISRTLSRVGMKRAPQGGAMVYTFRASDGAPDRDGDRINPLGWDLAAYNANPIILLQHDASALPVGKARAYSMKEGLFVDVTFDPNDPIAVEVEGKIASGFLNAVSVRGTVKSASPNELGGLDVHAIELLEVSIVTIPANPRAVLLTSAPAKAAPSPSPLEKSMTAAPALKSAPMKLNPVAPAPWNAITLGKTLRAVYDVAAGPLPDASRVAAHALATFKDPALAKALQESGADALGLLAPLTRHDRVFELLRPQILTAINPMRLPVITDVILPVEDLQAQVSWVDEGSAPAEGAPKMKGVVIKSYKAQAWVPVGNDLLRSSDGEEVLGRMVLRAVADTLDSAAVAGTGAQGQPLGLFGQGTTSAVSGATIATWAADLNAMLESARNANSRDEDLVFLLSPSRASALMALRDSAGFAFRDELTRGRLLGIRTVVSPRVPAAKLGLVDGSRVVIGTGDTSFSVHRGVPTYAERDQSVIRVVMKFDVKALSTSAVSVLNG